MPAGPGGQPGPGGHALLPEYGRTFPLFLRCLRGSVRYRFRGERTSRSGENSAGLSADRLRNFRARRVSEMCGEGEGGLPVLYSPQFCDGAGPFISKREERGKTSPAAHLRALIFMSTATETIEGFVK